MLRRHVVPLLLSSLVACTREEAPDIETTESRVQGGVVDDEHTFAVGIRIMQPSGKNTTCSGVLIAPNLVLTAQHCLSASTGGRRIKCDESRFTEQVSPDSVLVTTESTFPEDTRRTYGVTNVIVPEERELCGSDIALVVLAKNVPETEATPATPQVKRPLSERGVVGKEIAAIGYGQTSATTKDAGQRHIKTDIPVRCIPGDKARDCKSWDVPTNREFRTRGSVCSGDSGSGAFDPATLSKAPVAFGILSRHITNGADCLDAIYTRTDMHAKLIVSTAIVAAADGGYEAPEWTRPDSGEEPPPENAPAKSEDREKEEEGGGFEWPSLDDLLGWLDKWLPKLDGASPGERRPPSADEPGAPGVPETTKPPVPAGGDRTAPPSPNAPRPSSEDREEDEVEDDAAKEAKDTKPKAKASTSSGCAMTTGSSSGSTLVALALAAVLLRRRRSLR